VLDGPGYIPETVRTLELMTKLLSFLRGKPKHAMQDLKKLGAWGIINIPLWQQTLRVWVVMIPA
jgi:hypothetical protein